MFNKNNDQTNFSIIKTNFILDCQNFWYNNFVNSYKGYIPLISFILYKFIIRIPHTKYIRNNSFINPNLIKKNKIIKVKPVTNFNNILNYSGAQNILDKNIVEFELKHIPEFNFTPNILKKNSDCKDLVDEENLKIKLAGIEYINREGIIFLNKLFNNKNNVIFNLKFNNQEIENNKESIIGWLLIKNNIFSFSPININILLAKKGFAKICNFNTKQIYDEKIFYFMNDLLEAEKDAKIRSIGIWSSQKSNIMKDYANENNYWKKFFASFKYKKWHKIILRKND